MAGQQDTRHTVLEPLLYHDLTGMVHSSVKYAYELRDPHDIPLALRTALSRAFTPHYGPVFLSVPMDFMDKDAGEPAGPFVLPGNMAVDREGLQEVAEMIDGARSPCIVAGYENDIYGHFGGGVEALADAIGCPVFAEPLASRSPCRSRDCVDSDLQPAAALINMSLLPPHDLVILVGADLTLYPYTPPIGLLPGKRVVYIGYSPTGRHSLQVYGNPDASALYLSTLVKRKGERVHRERVRDNTRLAIMKRKRESGYILSLAAEVFRDRPVVDEAISSSPPVLRSTFGYRSGMYFTARSGQLGGWGGLPAATGMALAGRPSLLVIGDGSLMYTVQTLWTAKKYGADVKVVVLNNHSYGILRSFASSYYEDAAGKEYLKFDLDIHGGVAKSYGIPSMDLEERHDVVELSRTEGALHRCVRGGRRHKEALPLAPPARIGHTPAIWRWHGPLMALNAIPCTATFVEGGPGTMAGECFNARFCWICKWHC
ncbi:thiamine pyrophosphate-binding protein [Thermogymnomonas acidicola]|uniref:thiamine pyrophosphate-dependent enzyme n=1 Tax=Thermogymnomonas acidicola TaxID=399579 RepID=UPI0009464140|nr:thiamine pyrophosphate-dependent enzyme [Thermogymnomonas acidicola]